jgi:hypothetical protein
MAKIYGGFIDIGSFCLAKNKANQSQLPVQMQNGFPPSRE